jgi:hypothetical protein
MNGPAEEAEGLPKWIVLAPTFYQQETTMKALDSYFRLQGYALAHVSNGSHDVRNRTVWAEYLFRLREIVNFFR